MGGGRPPPSCLTLEQGGESGLTGERIPICRRCGQLCRYGTGKILRRPLPLWKASTAPERLVRPCSHSLGGRGWANLPRLPDRGQLSDRQSDRSLRKSRVERLRWRCQDAGVVVLRFLHLVSCWRDHCGLQHCGRRRRRLFAMPSNRQCNPFCRVCACCTNRLSSWFPTKCSVGQKRANTAWERLGMRLISDWAALLGYHTLISLRLATPSRPVPLGPIGRRRGFPYAQTALPASMRATMGA